MLYSVTLTFIFRVKHFLIAFAIKSAQTANVSGRFASTRTGPAVELLLSRSKPDSRRRRCPTAGIDSSIRPGCGAPAVGDACALSMRHRIVPLDATSAYLQWSSGDVLLDWYGAQVGQGSYLSTPAGGSPLIWTTST